MPYGRNSNNKNHTEEEEETIEVSSPACYMGIVDWDYGFDNFFSKDIASRRRSCHKSKSQQGESSNEKTCTTSSVSCTNNSNNNENSVSDNSKNNQQQGPTTPLTSEPSQQQQEQQQAPEQKETKQEEQDTFISPNAVSTTTITMISSPPTTTTSQEIMWTQNNHHYDGTTEDFSDFFGEVGNEEWIQGDIMDDDNDDEVDFGSLTEFKENDKQEQVLKEDTHNDHLLNAWETVLSQVYLDDKKTMTGEETYHEEWVLSSHGPKSIRNYVLEEAHESVHSKVTWTSVTYSMDQDTGIAKVKWPSSKIEEMYLNALDCQRIDEKSTAPHHVSSMLAIGEDEEYPSSYSSEEEDILPSSLRTTSPETIYPQQQPSSVKSPTTPTASIKSPIFGFSFSKLLPRLSTTSLPRSDSSTPTSATSSTTQRYSLESIPRTSGGTGTTSPGKEHSLSRTSSPIPSYPMAASPSPIIPQNNQNDTFHDAWNQPVEDHNDGMLSKTTTREKRYSMPVTSKSHSTTHSMWKPALSNNSIIMTDDDELPPSQQSQPQRRRPMTMINTSLANKSFSILDLDDSDNVTLVSTPPPSSKSFSFTPLVPTPTRTFTIPLTPLTPLTPKKKEEQPPQVHVEEKNEEKKQNKRGDLHDLLIGDSIKIIPAVLSPVFCETKQEEDQEFGEFADAEQANDDDFGDFVLSNDDGQEQEEEWGDWSGGCNNNFTVITSH